MIRKICAVLGGALVICLSVIGLYTQGKKRGAEEQKAANNEEVLKNAVETQKHIDNLDHSPNAVDKRLLEDCRD